MTENKTYNQAEVDEIIYKVKNIRKAFLEGIDSNLKSIQNIKETFATGVEKQIEKLQNLQPAEPEQKEWRQKPEINEYYYFVTDCGIVGKDYWGDDYIDNYIFIVGNCFPCELFTEEQVQQIAWQNRLNSLLYQYAVINNALASKEDQIINGSLLHWIGSPNTVRNNFRSYPNVPIFNSEDVTEMARKDVVEPFLAEHPDFVW